VTEGEYAKAVKHVIVDGAISAMSHLNSRSDRPRIRHLPPFPPFFTLDLLVLAIFTANS
jgi:hypothetical protein